MKYIAIFCLILAVSSGYLGSQVGRFLDIRERKPIEVRNNCAYYDMDSGDFTWGARPVTIGMGEQTQTSDPVLDMPKITPHKRKSNLPPLYTVKP